MKKERIYLTDITLHSKDQRPTINFKKAAQKGRLYSPTLTDQFKTSTSEGSDFEIAVQFPPEIQEKINNGEIELMMPAGGLFIYPGKDVIEAVKAMEKKERNLLIHRGRKGTWHAE